MFIIVIDWMVLIELFFSIKNILFSIYIHYDGGLK